MSRLGTVRFCIVLPMYKHHLINIPMSTVRLKEYGV